ncbi:hypothetical protein [Streptomyces sp. NPDC002209]|uniref:hypothetical protein n=1 Tax=Streptomyces sp. NPDC002209 TaxID=3364638 RepID=UPI0036CA0813
MAALNPLRKAIVVAVSAAAVLIGTGSAFAASGAAPLADDPSGAKLLRNTSLKAALGANKARLSTYYYYIQGW